MASGVQVRVVGTTYVPLLRPPPPHLEQIPLSFFDAWFLPLPPIQRIFLYDGDGADDTSFPSLVRALKSSLADAIAVFFPLAGKLTYLPSTGDVVVDCSPSAVGAGVAFLEAEASGGDARLLSGEATHDVPAFLGLVPDLEASELPAPVLAVQVTRFVDGGGLAVGVAIHHAVADGHSFWRFMSAWSAVARGGAFPVALAPTFDRSAIVHPIPMATEMARDLLRKLTPELPMIPTENWLRRTWLQHETTTLELDRHQIEHLKNRIADGELTRTAPRPSTFVAVSALVWSSAVQARSLDPGAATRLVFQGDCRRRVDPPVGEGYFGNCIKGCVAEAAAGELQLHGGGGGGGVVGAAKAIRKAIDEFVARPLDEFDRAGRVWGEPDLVAVVASPRFMPYSTDLGWGAPSRVEYVSESAPEGLVVITGGRTDGIVQVSACLRPVHMQAFRSRILDFVAWSLCVCVWCPVWR
ncbi:hypothetical protein HU200_056817 [Digitaria exilis]|uniref:Uncharacterized protein n=1 Tax=Digitaria exilis TaxID=1010633 RepID=A0A835AM03_9POAL|nr:hypothetical protein HU200_056817 [Digitaria exilis]CAB3502837.1 unnamed protein product [Digitaria exilis]